MTTGCVSIAYGKNAIMQATELGHSLEKYAGGPPFTVISDEDIAGTPLIFTDPYPGFRWPKLNLDSLSPYDYTIYLDADTRAKTDLSPIFDMLKDGWDFIIAPSGRQGNDTLGHLPQDDRSYTLDAHPLPLNLQAGVFGFRKSRGVEQLFRTWREEWLKFKGQDQGALVRALNRSPVKIWILGRCWNGGKLIEHYFGKAR